MGGGIVGTVRAAYGSLVDCKVRFYYFAAFSNCCLTIDAIHFKYIAVPRSVYVQ